MSLRNDIKSLQRRIGVKADGIFGPVSVAACHRLIDRLTLVPAWSEPEKLEKSEDHVFDDRTEKNLSGLTKAAQKKFRPFMARAQAIAAAMGCDYFMISGFRSYAEQNALYAKGRTKPGKKVTNARGGYSNHNFGDAGDNGVFKGGRYLDSYDPKLAARVHRAVAEIADKHGLEWGGNWRSFKDLPHFQVKSGMSMAQKRKAKKEGRLS